MEQLSLYRLTLLYMRLASVTFGGGNPTMAAMHTEMVVGRKWLSAEKYSVCYALARITPGTNMLAFCAGTAWELLGWPGAIAGVLAASVPAAHHRHAAHRGLRCGARQHLRHGRHRRHAGRRRGHDGDRRVGIAGALSRPPTLAARARHRGRVARAVAALRMPPIEVLALAAVVGLVWRIPE